MGKVNYPALSVLEGHSREYWNRRTDYSKRPRASRRLSAYRPIRGLVYGEVTYLGWGFPNPMKAIKKIGRVTAKVGRSAGHGVATVARVTQKKVLRPAAHGVATAGRATGHAIAEAARVTKRVARRIIKGLAKKVLFSGPEGLLGADGVARMSKTAAKSILLPASTAAIAASPASAAAPLVPILVNEVVDEIYEVLERNIKKGLSPKEAEEAAKSALDQLEPGEGGPFSDLLSEKKLPWVLGGAGAFLLLLIFSRRD